MTQYYKVNSGESWGIGGS